MRQHYTKCQRLTLKTSSQHLKRSLKAIEIYQKIGTRRVHVVSHGGWAIFNFCHVIEYWPLSGWSNAISDFSVTMLQKLKSEKRHLTT